MTQPSAFTRFRYRHDDAIIRSRKRIGIAAASLALAAVVMALESVVVGALLLAVPLVAWLTTPRQLLLGPRYLLCGNAIVYYANVKRMTLSPTLGKLRLECTNGMAFVLERQRFPRRVRTTEKLIRNRATRFDNLSTRIIGHVRAASANAVLISV